MAGPQGQTSHCVSRPPFAVHSSAADHVSGLPLEITNNATTNICVQVLCGHTFSGLLGAPLGAGSLGSIATHPSSVSQGSECCPSSPVLAVVHLTAAIGSLRPGSAHPTARTFCCACALGGRVGLGDLSYSRGGEARSDTPRMHILGESGDWTPSPLVAQLLPGVGIGSASESLKNLVPKGSQVKGDLEEECPARAVPGWGQSGRGGPVFTLLHLLRALEAHAPPPPGTGRGFSALIPCRPVAPRRCLGPPTPCPCMGNALKTQGL